MTQIKLRRDTAANFTSKNPVLGQGEPAYETDTKKMKIGDGTTAYNDLAYFDAGGGSTTPTMFPYAQKLTVDDLNKMTTNGLWYYDAYKGSPPANAPQTANERYFLEVLRYQEDGAPYGALNRTLQRLTYIYSSTINKTYIRSGIVEGYTQWTPWVELGGSSSSSSKGKVPDTTAAIDIAPDSNNYWTAPADGVVFTGGVTSTGAGFAVHEGHSIDETFSYIKNIITVAGDMWQYGWFPVVKGQEITFLFLTSNHVIRKFCPYKEIEVS